jgi:DNA processing protein
VPSKAEAEAELKRGVAAGARLIAACEPDFPRLLAVLDPPPPLLWTLGAQDLMHRRCVAVVGARTASAAGQRFARQLAADLSEAGYVVVSGMARGIDAQAHRGSLDMGAIGVMAGGVDDVYPPQNADLYQALAAQGLLVSERSMGHAARAADFPRRNRIISGLALGVVVVEAELRSGSLITARLAGEQGREVFAVPGSPLDPRAQGANDLIRQGATLVESAEDVLRVLDAQSALSETDSTVWSGVSGDDSELDPVRANLAELLSPTPISIDELARLAEAPVSAVLAALVELALAGRARLLAGGLVVSDQPD